MNVLVALAWSAWFAPLASLANLQDTSALHFAGVRAGATLQQISSQVRRRRGQLRCDQAKSDRRVSECRGTLPDSASPGGLAIWVSAIDSTAGVITLSSPVTPATLHTWRDDLTRRYGSVAVGTQGSQKMMQWVHRGRMLRLTWRPEAHSTTVSISLVDGHVLDGWGHGRDTASSNP
jgi:hypothetical protein